MADNKDTKVQEEQKAVVKQMATLATIAKENGKKATESEKIFREMTQLTEKISGTLATSVSGKINDLFDSVQSGGRAERKEAKKQSKILKQQLDSIEDSDDKKATMQQVELLDALIKQDKKIVDGVTTAMGKAMPVITGVMMGVFADSPIVGAIAGFGVDFISERMKKRKERRQEIEKLVLEKQREEEATARQAAEEEAAKKKAEKEEKIAEKNSETAEKMSEAADKMNGETATPLNSGEDAQTAEARKEDMFIRQKQHDEHMSRLDQLIDNNQEGENGLDGLFGALLGITVAGVLSAFKTGVKGLFKGLWGGIKFVFKSVGGLLLAGLKKVGGALKGIGKTLLKGLKRLPLIGALIAGGKAIFDGFNSEGDILDKIKAGFTSFSESVLDFILGIPAWVIDNIFGTDIGGFVESEGGYTQLIGKLIGETAGKIVIFFEDLFNGIVDSLESAFQSVKDEFANIGQKFWEFVLGDPMENAENFQKMITEAEKKFDNISDKDLDKNIEELKEETTGVNVFNAEEEEAQLQALQRIKLKRERKREKERLERESIRRQKEQAQIIHTSDPEKVENKQQSSTAVVAPQSQTNIVNKGETRIMTKPTVHNTQGRPRENANGLVGVTG